jgi:hypothetical protein
LTAEQMLHMQEGQKYNPIVTMMTEKQLAEFHIELRNNMKLKLKSKQKMMAGVK